MKKKHKKSRERKGKKVEVSNWRNKLQKFTRINKDKLVVVGVVLGLLLISGIALTVLANKLSDNKTVEDSLKEDRANTKDIDILLTEDGFDPDEIIINRVQPYNFRILKDDNVQCNALENVQMGYVIDMSKKATEIPVLIPTKGEYIFKCKNQDAQINVTVK